MSGIPCVPDGVIDDRALGGKNARGIPFEALFFLFFFFCGQVELRLGLQTASNLGGVLYNVYGAGDANIGLGRAE